jgi:hypothetical protein
MGAMADAFAAYAQPLLDQTDGSEEQLNKALAVSMVCYNLALLTDDDRKRDLAEMRQKLEMDEQEFDEFQRSVIFPMIARHQEMFPRMSERIPEFVSQFRPRPVPDPGKGARTERYPGTAPYAPCPCNSGEKYKFCCRAKGR